MEDPRGRCRIETVLWASASCAPAALSPAAASMDDMAWVSGTACSGPALFGPIGPVGAMPGGDPAVAGAEAVWAPVGASLPASAAGVGSGDSADRSVGIPGPARATGASVALLCPDRTAGDPGRPEATGSPDCESGTWLKRARSRHGDGSAATAVGSTESSSGSWGEPDFELPGPSGSSATARSAPAGSWPADRASSSDEATARVGSAAKACSCGPFLFPSFPLLAW